MDIKDLRARQGNVELIAVVIDKSSQREFDKGGNKGRVCNARIKDDTGSVVLSLWNEQIDLVNVGDKIKITNGYVSEWQGELQLSTGKFGKLDVIEKGAGKQEIFTNAPANDSGGFSGSSEEGGDYEEPEEFEEEEF